MPPLLLPHQEGKTTGNTHKAFMHREKQVTHFDAKLIWELDKNDPHEGYCLGALCPQPHSSPACSLWSASCCNSWPEPQPHVVSGTEGQLELGFACAFWQWQRELVPPRERGGLGSPWKEIQKCQGAKTKYLVYEEASQTDQVCHL